MEQTTQKREFKTTSKTFDADVEEQLQFSVEEKLDLIATGVTLIVTGDEKFAIGEFSYIANTIASKFDFIHSNSNLCIKVKIDTGYNIGERRIIIRPQTQEDRDEDAIII
jgi:hypothetical protein